MFLATKHNFAMGAVVFLAGFVGAVVGGFLGFFVLIGMSFCGGMYLTQKYDDLYVKQKIDETNARDFKSKIGFLISYLMLFIGVGYVVLANYLYNIDSQYLQTMIEVTSSTFLILTDVPAAQTHFDLFQSVNRETDGRFWQHIVLFFVELWCRMLRVFRPYL